MTGVKRHVFFDSQTHLIVKEDATIGGIDEQILYDDYRSLNGLKIPYKIELHRGTETYDIAVTRAQVNGTVGERVFDFPKKSQVQLPDLKALFKEIDENQKAIDKLKENYAGTRSEEETEYDKTGKINERELHEYSFFYLSGHEVSTLVKKDGKPLSEEEQKKENDKVQKEIRISRSATPRERPRKKRPRRKAKRRKTMTSASRHFFAPANLSIPGASASAAKTSWSLTSSLIPTSSLTN